MPENQKKMWQTFIKTQVTIIIAINVKRGKIIVLNIYYL